MGMIDTFKVKIKYKGYNVYKCKSCTAIFKIEAMDNQTQLNYCPTCGGKNEIMLTVNIFNDKD